MARVRFALLLGVLACVGSPDVARGNGTPIVLPDGRGLSPAGRMVAAGDFPAGALLDQRGGLLVDTREANPTRS